MLVGIEFFSRSAALPSCARVNDAKNIGSLTEFLTVEDARLDAMFHLGRLIILNPRFSTVEHWFDSKLTPSDLLFKISYDFVAVCFLETQKPVREVFADIVPCESI